MVTDTSADQLSHPIATPSIAQGSAISLMVASVLVPMVCGTLYAWSLYVLPIERTFHWNRAQTSLTFTFAIVCWSLGMLAGGAVVDWLGRKRTMLIGGLVGALGFFLATYTQSLPWLYASYGIMSAFGMGIMYVVVLTTAPKSFPRQSSTVVGTIMMGFGLGTLVLGTFIIARIIERSGWRNGLRVTSVLALAATALAILFVHPRGQSRAAKMSSAERAEWGYTMKEMICTPTFWIYSVWIVACQAGGLMVIGHIVPYARESGITIGLAALAMGIFSFVNSLGRPLAGLVVDRVQRRISMFCLPIIMVLGLAIVGWATRSFGFTGLVVGAIIVAISYGGIFTLNASLILNFFGPRHFSANMGFQGLSMLVGSMLGPQIAGIVRTRTGSYTGSFIAAIVLIMIGLLFGQLVKEPSRSRLARASAAPQ